MTDNKTHKFDRALLEQLLIKRFFFAPSFSIYGGVAGLYDYGPPGCALQANVLQLWRQHFVLEEDMLELDCSIMTPAEVLKTSGHVDKFTDWMCKDTKTGEIFRADHLVEGVLEARLEGDAAARCAEQGAAITEILATGSDAADAKKKKKTPKGKTPAVKLDDAVKAEYQSVLAQIDNYDGEGLTELIARFSIKSPETGNELSKPVEFNLMFESSIGPTGHIKGYLRPETAQGQFLNFKKLLEFNNERMPFASAQIGRSFRNEISPRSGLLRVREFTMAEIEHYVDPDNKDHPRFSDVSRQKLRLLPASVQLEGRTEVLEMAVGEAVEKSIIDNQTLGYFLARVHLFLVRIGIDPTRLRFRQHLSNEMAHYACDCWDAEILTSYGWIECVGCADRSAYDLTVHAARTKEKLVVREPLAEPRVFQRWQMEINKKVFGPAFKKAAKAVTDALTSMTECELSTLKDQMDQNGGKATITATDSAQYEVTDSMITIQLATVTEHVREYTPNVIEPSFGIGRILYSLMEHVYWTRPEDEQRSVLSFPTIVAPIKCLVQPLSNHKSFQPFTCDIAGRLRRLGISNTVDNSSVSVGRTYARNDELGTPFGITVDFQTVQDGTITLRERDSTKQIREKIETVLDVVKQLVEEKITWEDVVQQYPSFTQQELE